MVLGEVFGRLADDNTVPAIHRLERAFGGESLYRQVKSDATSQEASDD